MGQRWGMLEKPHLAECLLAFFLNLTLLLFPWRPLHPFSFWLSPSFSCP
jgi:hypothetical protein